MRRAIGWTLAAALFAALLWQRQILFSQATPAPALADDATASIRVQLGVTDAEPRAWDGAVTATAGDVVRVRNWHPRPGDEVDGKAKWKLATRRGINFAMRGWDVPRLYPPAAYMLIPGVVADVKGHAGTRVRIETAQGAFEVSPFTMEAGVIQQFLGGAVLVDRVPVAQELSPESEDSDFATLAADADGRLWTAWVAFRGGRNEVRMRHFDGKVWQPAVAVSGDHRDIFLVKAARDGAGRVWFLWSAQAGDNWDLYARRWDGRSWSAIERVTSAPQPDIYHNVAVDSRGHLWVVWQGFRDGAADIFARRHDGSAWQPEEKLSTSPANDWEPAIAADGAGRVWVAWDTYAEGNYDIVLRKMENGRWSEIATVASTPRFEAHVSLACDKNNRLWAAWNESGFEWGKDTGFLVKIEGTRLYASRWMSVKVFDGGTWFQPADIETSLPAGMRGYNDLPTLLAGGDGRIWLFFRHRMLRVRDTPSDTPAH
ncbi:MAG: TolB family protein, partial [Bryobacteraceae bacterium]